jgi:hypothetical protein
MMHAVHPWSYKPASCWLHPISVRDGELRLHDALSDPYNLEGYPGYASATMCGSICGTKLAREVLRPELDYLAAIIGKELR